MVSWVIFCPALSRIQGEIDKKIRPQTKRCIDVRCWALTVFTLAPSPCWYLPDLPSPSKVWLLSLWPGPEPERTVPFLCPHSLAELLAMLCTGASARPPRHCCSHIWGSDEREWTRYPGPISHPRVPECPPCPGKYGRPWECPSWSSTVHLSQTPGHKWSLVLLIWGA